VVVHHRTDFAASMIDGRTVMEVKDTCKSAQEVASLWRYVKDRLDRVGEETSHFDPRTGAPAPRVNALGKAVPAFGRRVSA